MAKSYNTINDLRDGIAALQLKKSVLEGSISKKFSSPAAVFSTAISIVANNRGSGKKSASEGLGDDLISGISRLVVPVLLNSFIFKRSGFLTKSLVALISQNIASKVNTTTLTDLVGSVKDMISNFKKPKKAEPNDYGIPPDSETY